MFQFVHHAVGFVKMYFIISVDLVGVGNNLN